MWRRAMLDFKITNLTTQPISLGPRASIILAAGEQRVVSTVIVPTVELIYLSRTGKVSIDEILDELGGQPFEDLNIKRDVEVKNETSKPVKFNLATFGGSITVSPGDTVCISTYEVPLEDIMNLVEAGVLSLVSIKNTVGGTAAPLAAPPTASTTHADSYNGNDAPGTGSNTLDEGASRIWNKIDTVQSFLVTRIGSAYRLVELTDFS